MAIVALGFGAFLLLRRRYGFAMAFITPLVILLLGLSEPDPWIDIRDRVIDTVSGGALAMIAAYVLWPQWERERLSTRIAEALRVNATYMTQVFAMLSDGATMDSVIVARRIAETETGNAEAALQRMMSEPKSRRGRPGRWHALATHLRRLNRHVGALAAHMEEVSIRSPEVRPLADALARGLASAAENIDGGKAARYEAPEADIVKVHRALTDGASNDADEAISLLVGRIASDVGALYAASVGR